MSSFMRAMLLPPGYPNSVADSYARYRSWSLLSSLIAYPKAVLMSMAFWGRVYGVGNSNTTPLSAVVIDIFLISVDAVAGLAAGMPALASRLDYSNSAWR